MIVPVGNALDALVRQNLRLPDTWWLETDTGLVTATFTPPLTATEQTAFADLQTMARLGITANLTLAEFQAIKSQLLEVRTFRSRTLAQWNALTATQREADQTSYLNDLADVLRALLRQ
jgi:hypothetical protein